MDKIPWHFRVYRYFLSFFKQTNNNPMPLPPKPDEHNPTLGEVDETNSPANTATNSTFDVTSKIGSQEPLAEEKLVEPVSNVVIPSIEVVEESEEIPPTLADNNQLDQLTKADLSFPSVDGHTDSEDPTQIIEQAPKVSVELANDDDITVEKDFISNDIKFERQAAVITYIDQYKRCLTEMEVEGFQKDFDTIRHSIKKYECWKNYVINLASNFENELHHEFLSVLEKPQYGVVRDRNKYVLVTPVSAENDKNAELLQQMADMIPLISDLNDLPDTVMRIAGDLDFRISVESVPTKLHGMLKKKVNTIILTLKQLENIKKELMSILSKVIAREKLLYIPLAELNSSALLQALSSTDLKEEEIAIEVDAILSETDSMLKNNFAKATETTQLSENLEKQYFELLRKTIFRAYNGLRDAYKHFIEDINRSGEQEREFLTKWSNIYLELTDLIQKFLLKHLHIQQIGAHRGDTYDDFLHHPIQSSEPDDELKDEQIKTVFDDGFKWSRGGESEIIIQPAHVQVVKNK